MNLLELTVEPGILVHGDPRLLRIGALAAATPAHPVCHGHPKRFVRGEDELFGRYIREQQLLRASPPQHDVVVLVLRALQARMRRGAELVFQIVGPLDKVLRRGQGGCDVFHGFRLGFVHRMSLGSRVPVSMRF